ncbi:HlyD family efflux transporter periplasmic adaptor subunit [Rhabdaerophilum sp. SD176]|uniref:HlyD family efflux transporter periplasmic adaptor subunit n=1 Tax=Rhabdaerophilum sp. SD176 TaxID=2983548 RepID=UPI0024E009C4|nr:HlyD family efflux transporter periplasmic adaptor subunit [Rhabdaerophilum sp. SD176]
MASGEDPADTARPPAGLPLVVVERQLPAPVKKSRLRPVLRALPAVPLVMGLLMTGGVIGLYFQPPGVRKIMSWLQLAPGGGTSNPIAVPAPSAPADTAKALPRAVIGLGKLLPEGEVVTVAPPYGAGDARISRMLVSEGERVAAGTLLGVLDNERQLLSALETAKANLASKEAVLAQVRNATAAGRAEAEAALARAETVAQNAVREFERVEELKRRGFASDQSHDQRRSQMEEAQRDVERNRASLTRYGQGELDRQPDIVVAARNVDLAKADLERAAADLERAYIRAPLAATVLSITARPGEKPGTGGILNLGDIDHMKAEIEIYQTEISRVALDARVEIQAEALPEALSGRVVRIGLEVGRQTITDPSPAANTDARVIKVTVRLDPASNVIARGFTNLPVRARILPTGP